jgi:hypothetical protein
VHRYAGCDEVQSETDSPAPAEVDEAVALARAVDSPTWLDAARGVKALLDRATRMSHRRGAALVWQRAPSLLATLEAEQDRMLERLRGLPLQTRAGILCRRAELRKISRYQWSMRDLGGRIETAGPAWGAVLTFEAGLTSAIRSFGDDVVPCLAAAPTNARDTIGGVMARA